MRLKFFILSWLLLALLGCSSTQTLHYYSLQPALAAPSEGFDGSFERSLGVGPIKLPESQIGDGIITLDKRYGIKLANEHLWAGDLKLAVSRSLSARLSALLDNDNIVAFPWDVRQKPAVQLFVNIEQFAGALDGEVVLAARWSYFDTEKRAMMSTHREVFTKAPQSRDYADYVADLNDLMEQFALALAKQLDQVQ